MTAEQMAAAAKSLNDKAAAVESRADDLRAQRDRLVIQLRLEHNWSYGEIAKAIGLSRGMVSVICRPVR